MNITSVTRNYLQEHFKYKIAKLNHETFEEKQKTKKYKKHIQAQAMSDVIDLGYSLRDALKIFDCYWPKKILKIERKYNLDYANQKYLLDNYDQYIYQVIITKRYIQAAASCHRRN